MLGKLMKHEFKATSRLMAPLLLAVLLLGVFVRIADENILVRVIHPFVNTLHGVLIFAFVVALFAAVICAVVLMVQRFSKNLMGDEGYLMFTLPVGHNQLLLSKLFTSVIWFLAVIVVDILAVLISVYQRGMAQDIVDFLSDTWRAMQNYYLTAHGWVVVELIALLLVSLAFSCLQFYAPISIGYSFAKRKGFLSVVFFFALQIIEQIAATYFLVELVDKIFDWNAAVYTAAETGAHTQAIILWTLGCMLVATGILYGITYLMMKKRLNLQ